MLNPTQGPAREKLERLGRGEVDALSRVGALVIDDRRRRPLYFDGRFLTARDLTHEQNYFLTRLADLGRSRGFGVSSGLHVVPRSGSSLRIDSGHGITPGGELVLLADPLVLDLADLAASQRLDATFGLSPIPRPPARNLTGLFVVALRAVEFTANPIASYPTTVDGARSVEDGDIVEATVATLVPYDAQATDSEPGRQRAHVAREVFVDGVRRAQPADALPLAMVSVERGVIRWVDTWMVRREVGSNHAETLGLGIAPRAMREAHALQYSRHLHDVLQELDRGGRTRRFPASQHFLALPAFGELPPAAIDPTGFSQVFFPSEMQVDLSVVPEDELPALMEEALHLPPIDLTLPSEQQQSTSVLVVVPVPRPQLRTLMSRLAGPVRALPPSAPTLRFNRLPIEALRGIALPRRTVPVPEPSTVDAAWQQVLREAETLWYLRRRNVSYRADLVGVSVREVVDEGRVEVDLIDRLRAHGLRTRFQALRNSATSLSAADLTLLMSSSGVASSRTLAEGALIELESLGSLERSRILPVVERFSAAGTGEGIAAIERAAPDLASVASSRLIAASKLVPELDDVARKLDENQLSALAEELGGAVATKEPERVAEVVRTWASGGRQ